MGKFAMQAMLVVCEGLSVHHGWVLSLVFTQGQAELFPWKLACCRELLCDHDVVTGDALLLFLQLL